MPTNPTPARVAEQTMPLNRAILGALPAILLVLSYTWGTIATIGWVAAMFMGGSTIAFIVVGLPAVALALWLSIGFCRTAIAGEREHG